MDIESKETLDAVVDRAATKFQGIGETLIASFFGNATKFIDETLPKVEATVDRVLDKTKALIDNEVTRLSNYKIGVLR